MCRAERGVSKKYLPASKRRPLRAGEPWQSCNALYRFAFAGLMPQCSLVRLGEKPRGKGTPVGIQQSPSWLLRESTDACDRSVWCLSRICRSEALRKWSLTLLWSTLNCFCQFGKKVAQHQLLSSSTPRTWTPAKCGGGYGLEALGGQQIYSKTCFRLLLFLSTRAGVYESRSTRVSLLHFV